MGKDTAPLGTALGAGGRIAGVTVGVYRTRVGVKGLIRTRARTVACRRVVSESVVSVGVLPPPRVQATVPISTADSISAERPHAKACRMDCMTFIV